VLHVQATVESGHDVSGDSVVRWWMVVVVTDGGAQCVLYTSQRGAIVSSTGCNNERQSFAKLSQSAPSRFARLLSGAQRLECIDDGKQAVGLLPRLDSPQGLSLGSSAQPVRPIFWFH